MKTKGYNIIIMGNFNINYHMINKRKGHIQQKLEFIHILQNLNFIDINESLAQDQSYHT